MPKVQIIEEELPLGASPKYDCDLDVVTVFVSPSKQIQRAGPGNKIFECPLLKTITKAEVQHLQAEVLKALPGATLMRVLRSAEGIGIYAMATDATYRPAAPTKVDPATVKGDPHHKRLWEVCREQADYLSGKDTQNHEKPDCSSGCRYFHPLEGKHGMDWGVCTEPRSPRAGLLTFEHMGCQYFEQAPEESDAEPAAPPPPRKPKAPKKPEGGGVV